MIIDDTLKGVMKYLNDYIRGYIENNEALQKENAELRDRMSIIQGVINEQAEDPSLWFIPHYATEEYLQAAIRRIHSAVEDNHE